MEPSKETMVPTNYLNQVATYLNHPSSAIRYSARENHNQALKYSRAPWYRSLQIANMEEDDDENDEDEYFNRGGLEEFSRNDILTNPVRFEYEKRKFHQFTPTSTTSSFEHH